MSYAGQDTTPVDLEEVTITKQNGNTFLITARGNTRTGGWSASLTPLVYTQEPEDWEISAIASCPHGSLHFQSITPWHASITMTLGLTTKKITVAGRDKITEDVPHKMSGVTD